MYECWSCGAALSEGFAKKRNFCPKCSAEKAETAKKNFNEYWRLKNGMTLERAVSRIEDDPNDPEIGFYRESIETVREYVEKNPQTLASTEEYIALIVLLAHEVKIKCQYKVLHYKIDFCLPELKVLLEIDGDRHKKLKDAKRDLEILGEVGDEWTIIRFPTKYINEYPKAIYDAVLDYKIEFDKQKRTAPGYVFQRAKAIEAAREERAQKEEAKRAMAWADFGYSNIYVEIPKKH